MKKIHIALICLLILTSLTVSAAENLPLHLKIMSTHSVVEPHIWKNTIFLTAKPQEKARFIGVAFEHESYSVIHPFKINESGIFIFTGEAANLEEIRYRLVIDGLWTSDPMNPNNMEDSRGIPVSRLFPEQEKYEKVRGPVSDDHGRTTFSIRTIPDSTVSIVGSFNGWDPYMTPLVETSPGIYSAGLRLQEGFHYYYFIVDGQKAMDPMNFARAMNREGEEVCKIEISRS